MKTLLKSLLIPALCAFFLLQAQPANAQSKDNDVLVMEYGSLYQASPKTHGLYIYWPDKDVEFISLEFPSKSEDVVANKKLAVKKINELADLGWELEIVDNSMLSVAYYFKRATPK
ncbi:MAG TPA: hypothetical protein VHS96_04440 [Bacteroidia bacterium]|nr:hypothetical protein [Bacteroidia bacterium]